MVMVLGGAILRTETDVLLEMDGPAEGRKVEAGAGARAGAGAEAWE